MMETINNLRLEITRALDIHQLYDYVSRIQLNVQTEVCTDYCDVKALDIYFGN